MVRALLYGLGPIGILVARQLATRDGFRIVAAVDIDPAKVGHDVAEIAGLARPMRVYGSRGLRLDPTDMAGGRDTTPQERDASLRSLCGLEPEGTAAALAGTLPADELLVVTKARNEVSHKGGQLISEGDSGDRCFVSWLSGHVEPPYCDAAVSP